jgi:hypothetical protein
LRGFQVEDKLIDVYIYSEKIYGTIKSMGAFASMVSYELDGVQYEELLENDDFTIIGESN